MIASEQVPKLSSSLIFVVVSQSCIGADFTSFTLELACEGIKLLMEVNSLPPAGGPKPV